MELERLTSVVLLSRTMGSRVEFSIAGYYLP
jgi:hypothetical protein